MFHRLFGCTAAAVLPKQDSGTSQIQVNPTKVREQMGHPVHVSLYKHHISRMETEADVAVVSSALRGFLSYLEANRAKFFTSKNYVEAGEDYISRAAQEAE